MTKLMGVAAALMFLFMGQLLAQPATSQPTSQPSYMGKPVTAAWVYRQFASRGRFFYRAGDLVVNSVETNADTNGKPLPLVTGRTSELRKGGIYELRFGTIIDAQYGVAKVELATKGETVYVYNEKLLKGQRTGMLLYCLSHSMIGGNRLGIKNRKGQPAGTFYSCMFLPAKPATKDDFIEWLAQGKPLVTGYKQIAEEAARELEEGEYRVKTDGDKKTYWVPVIVNP